MSDTQIPFTESEERRTLRREVARLAKGYGRDYFTAQAHSGATIAPATATFTK